MSRVPDFDELVGTEPAGGERERLRRAHELLLAAGPPPELSPELEAGPTLAMTLSQRRRRLGRRRLALLAAAVAAVAAVFLAGYVAGNGGGGATGAQVVQTIQLHGTSAAPAALGSLRVEAEDAGGNWPMTLSVTGLPQLPQGGYYAVYLVRNGTPWRPCGWFRIGKTADTGVTVRLSVPYAVDQGDSWVVTEQPAGTTGPGRTVMRPVT